MVITKRDHARVWIAEQIGEESLVEELLRERRAEATRENQTMQPSFALKTGIC